VASQGSRRGSVMEALRVVRIAIMTWVLGMAAAFPARGDGTSAARTEGMRHYSAGRFAEAIPYFDHVVARHRRDLEVLLRRGTCSLRTDQPEKAIADFDRVNNHERPFTHSCGIDLLSPISPNPRTVDFAESWGNRGSALLMLGRDQEALQSFQQAI